jgi:hypothetical protein
MVPSSPRAEVIPRNFLEKGGHRAKGTKVESDGERRTGEPSSFECRGLIARKSLRFNVRRARLPEQSNYRQIDFHSRID